MPAPDNSYWNDQILAIFQRYEEALIREVARQFIRPRNQWPVEDIIDRLIEAMANPPLIDRRIRELPSGCAKILALIEVSKQPRWRVGSLLEMATALGEEDPFELVIALLNNGLLCPDLAEQQNFPDVEVIDGEEIPATPSAKLKNFRTWMTLTAPEKLYVISHPSVTRRTSSIDLGLPNLAADQADHQPAFDAIVQEADGLEWLIRLVVLQQAVLKTSLRKTMSGELFKRDLERLQQDGMFSDLPNNGLRHLQDIPVLIVSLGVAAGVLKEENGEIQAGAMPEEFSESMTQAISHLWSCLPRLTGWDCANGVSPSEMVGNPFPAVNLLGLLLLAQIPEKQWCSLNHICDWIYENHPYWQKSAPSDLKEEKTGVTTFLGDVAFQLRLVQLTDGPNGVHFVRLSPLGRWLILGEAEPNFPGFGKTLLVQPNLEILLYRQGLTPELLVKLGRIASWKSIGPACHLQLEPETVYAALEQGESFESIVQLLNQHGMKAIPTSVIDSLRTWSEKRERLTIYPASVILEFRSKEDLEDALTRGTPLIRISDRLGLVPSEKELSYQHFKLSGNRDYTAPSEPCVTVDDDGVTLVIDSNKSDLLLETEIARFATLMTSQNSNEIVYRVTPESAKNGLEIGATLETVEEWFLHRTGGTVPPATRLLMNARKEKPPHYEEIIVLRVGSDAIADGLEQWPESSRFISERLGPMAFAIAKVNLSEMTNILQMIGFEIAISEEIVHAK